MAKSWRILERPKSLWRKPARLKRSSSLSTVHILVLSDSVRLVTFSSFDWSFVNKGESKGELRSELLSRLKRKKGAMFEVVQDLEHLESRSVEMLCHLEKVFPPFFTIMVHTATHLISEAKVGGPVLYRRMHPIESCN
ncbi:uncharacterized protein LOC131162685 [Malania oleifera]|uniref:uncharacterized protein LOC131162685 n=1 Tax=Malania oleifera TaxID=397392 RepID=UPI0025AE0AE7|nr:uncharacterized protein LOC131162685 [Malania oleifera]